MQNAQAGGSAAVPLAFEVEVQVEDAALEGALETLLVRVLPLLVDDAEGDVLVGRPRLYPQNAGVSVLVRLRILLQAAPPQKFGVKTHPRRKLPTRASQNPRWHPPACILVRASVSAPPPSPSMH